jgi:hypothetical protein
MCQQLNGGRPFGDRFATTLPYEIHEIGRKRGGIAEHGRLTTHNI